MPPGAPGPQRVRTRQLAQMLPRLAWVFHCGSMGTPAWYGQRSGLLATAAIQWPTPQSCESPPVAGQHSRHGGKRGNSRAVARSKGASSAPSNPKVRQAARKKMERTKKKPCIIIWGRRWWRHIVQPARCLEHVGYLGPGIGNNARGAPEVNRVAADGAREDGFCSTCSQQQTGQALAEGAGRWSRRIKMSKPYLAAYKGPRPELVAERRCKLVVRKWRPNQPGRAWARPPACVCEGARNGCTFARGGTTSQHP